MQGAKVPRIGLITDSDLNRHVLQILLQEQGYQLVLSLNAEGLNGYFDSESVVELDAWLVDIVSEDTNHIVELLMEKSQLPLLVNDNIPLTQELSAHEEWRRRLIGKLEVVAQYSDVNNEQNNDIPFGQEQLTVADHIWVLAASLGGPDAVKRFIDCLPAGLKLAMVYAQHIEVNFDEVLASAMAKKQNYPVHVVRTETCLSPGTIAVVPADRQLRFLPHGKVIATRKPWMGLYKPTIDQVISDLARIYRNKLGVIIFSGLCNDGEIGCRVAKACGATIWVQTPESCQSPEMVNAALSTGCVSFQGTPEQLAQALGQR